MVSSVSIQNSQQQYFPATTSPQEIKVPPKTLERTPDADTIAISKPKKEISSSQKWVIGLSSAVIGLSTAGILMARHQGNKIGKLYKDKLVLSNLGENIVFKEAASVEEGIKFAKEVLKIKDVDSNFTLEAINWANKGLVDVSNANKGKVVMPTALRFNKQEGSSAYVVQNIKRKGHPVAKIQEKLQMNDTPILI